MLLAWHFWKLKCTQPFSIIDVVHCMFNTLLQIFFLWNRTSRLRVWDSLHWRLLQFSRLKIYTRRSKPQMHKIFLAGTRQYRPWPRLSRNRIRLMTCSFLLRSYHFYGFWPVLEAEFTLPSMSILTVLRIYSILLAINSYPREYTYLYMRTDATFSLGVWLIAHFYSQHE